MKSLRTTIALALATGLSAVMWSAAPAAANDGDCAPNDFCLYENASLGGGRWDVFGAVANYQSGQRWWGTTVTINDGASSTRNRHGMAMALCEHSWGRGDNVYVGGGITINYLSDYEFQDRGSSNYW